MQHGFSGRACKIADTCYTFWIGASIRIICQVFGDKAEDFFDKKLLIDFLKASYDGEKHGFGKKPGIGMDLYHTCYTLIGISCLGLSKDIDPKIIDDIDPILTIRNNRSNSMRKYFESV